MRQGKVRIEDNGLAQMGNRLSQRRFVPTVQRDSPERLAISAPGVKIIRTLPPDQRQFRTRQLRFKLADNLTRDVVLEIECVRGFHVKALRPDLFSAFGIDKLNRNSD